MTARAGALAPQFEDLAQQRETVTLGMWVFLVTELLFFGGLFTAYAIYRGLYPDAFAEGSRLLAWKAGAVNTAVLITSSLTVALGVHAATAGRNRRAAILIAATLALGAGFLVVKALEYRHKFEQGLMPFQSEGGGPVRLFFWIYLVMTGLHAVHVIAGLGALAWVLARAARNRFGPENEGSAEVVGLYWHFVDVVWIFLFPLLYLVGRHG